MGLAILYLVALVPLILVPSNTQVSSHFFRDLLQKLLYNFLFFKCENEII